MTQTNLRQELGDFSSIVCFKAVITGVEDTLGKDGAAVVFIRAGKVRGHALARELGVAGSDTPVEQLAGVLNSAIGRDGTCLCGVRSVQMDGENYVVETFDTVCSAGEDMGSDRELSFTMGAIAGALEAVTGKMLMPRQIESVLRGGQYDTIVLEPL